MRPWLRPWVLLLLGFLALAAIACQEAAKPLFSCLQTFAATEPDLKAFPVTITDSQGNEVTFPGPPGRMVVLAPSFVEVLYALGAGADIVAVDETSDCPLEAAEKTKLSGYTPSLEAIAAMEPDLVILFFDPGDLQASLARLGIPVLFLATPESVAAVFDQIRLLGQVTGRSEEAEDLVAAMQRRIEAIQEKLVDIQQGPRIFHELDPLLFTVGPGSFIDDMYRLVKAQNIAAETGQPYPQVDQETVIAKDPEVIILADEPAGVTVESVKARPGWGNLSAIVNDRVHVVDPDIFSRPGPRLVEAVELLAKLLYPERFP